MRLHRWTILCDFDGTVSEQDVTDTILRQLARPGWEDAEDEWVAGRIGSRECMTRQVRMIDGTPAQLDHVIDGIGIDPDFSRFVSLARSLDIPLEIVSDGLDYPIQRLLATDGVGPLPVAANTLSFTPGAGWDIGFPYSSASCASGNCKCACAMQQKQRSHRTLLIGDGQSDICVAGEVDFVFAKQSLLAHCIARRIPHRPIRGFADAIALLPRLAEGTLTAPSATRSTPSPTAPTRVHAR